MVKVFAEDVRPDSVGVEFDDERLVANAGLLMVATLSRRLGIESLVDKTVRLGERAGATRPGRKVLTLIHAIVAGADSIDDADVLRSGASEALLGHKAMAPSTLGTFLRAFTFGHVRQLDRVLAETIKRAWAAGAGPGALAWRSRSTASSARPKAPSSRAPPAATPGCAATTRSSPPGRGPARSCTCGRARERRRRDAAPCASAKS